MSEAQRKSVLSKRLKEVFGDNYYNEVCDMLNGEIGSIRGHFWVELEDGTIIDPDFEVYDAIKYMKNLEGDKIYRECDSEIQKQTIRSCIIPYMSLLSKELGLDEIKKIRSYTKLAEFEGVSDDSFKAGQCHLNAMINKVVYGKTARICYGDMGWAFKEKPNEIFYEFEHGWNGKHDDRCDMMKMMERLQKRPDMFNLLMKSRNE